MLHVIAVLCAVVVVAGSADSFRGRRPVRLRAPPPAQATQSPSIAALVVPYGYPLEEHFVTTQDGYILRMFRIPGARHSKGRDGGHRPVVVLQHGLLDSSSCFLLLGPGKALGLMLADAGYDVWLGNSRGNAHSRNHTSLNVSSDEFWAFSFDEMASYDVPAELDYIQRVTRQAQVTCVGYSQGGTLALAALSSQPQLAKRIKAAVLMAPIAYMNHIKSQPLLFLASLDDDARLSRLLQLLGRHEFMPRASRVQRMESEMCRLAPQPCGNLLAAIGGFDVKATNATKMPLYLDYTPSSTCVQNMAHYLQAVRQKRPHTLARFDFGTDCSKQRGGMATCNQAKYGSETPPEYPLWGIKTPLMLLSGGRDVLADPTDVQYLREVLGKGVVRTDVHIEQFQHLDFEWAEGATELAYRPIIDFLNMMNKS